MNYGYNLNWQEFMELFPELAPVIIPIAILALILTAAALISLFKKKLPFSQIAIWLIIIIAVNLIGSVIYFAIGSKMLDEKKQTRGDEK